MQPDTQTILGVLALVAGLLQAFFAWKQFIDAKNAETMSKHLLESVRLLNHQLQANERSRREMRKEIDALKQHSSPRVPTITAPAPAWSDSSSDDEGTQRIAKSAPIAARAGAPAAAADAMDEGTAIVKGPSLAFATFGFYMSLVIAALLIFLGLTLTS